MVAQEKEIMESLKQEGFPDNPQDLLGRKFRFECRHPERPGRILVCYGIISGVDFVLAEEKTGWGHICLSVQANAQLNVLELVAIHREGDTPWEVWLMGAERYPGQLTLI